MTIPLDYSDRLAGVWLNPAFIARRGLTRRLTPMLSAAVAPGSAWVDVGCGTRPYESCFAGARYTGVDVEQSGRHASGKKPDLYYDGRVLPLNDASVDGILSTEVLEHVADPGELVAEFRRVLRPGGVLVASLPLLWSQHEKPYDFQRFTEFGARRLFESGGFEVREMSKSCGTVEALAQAATTYIAGELISLLPFGRSVFLAGVCAPIQLAGIVLGRVLPDAGDLYVDNVVLARKIP